MVEKLVRKQHWNIGGGKHITKLQEEGCVVLAVDYIECEFGGKEIDDISTNYLQRLNELGVGSYYDILSYHIYPQSYDTSFLKDNLQKFQELAGNKLIWITESGVNGKITEESEKQQAAWLIKNYVFNTARGVNKIFWFTLSDMGSAVPEEMVGKYAGLLTSISKTTKLSYYTYKKMVEMLDGSDWDNIQTIRESGDVYIYKFSNNGKDIWVAWNDNSASQTISLSELGITGSAKITNAIPDADSGSEVSSYLTAFNTYAISQEIELGDVPVFIEE